MASNEGETADKVEEKPETKEVGTSEMSSSAKNVPPENGDKPPPSKRESLEVKNEGEEEEIDEEEALLASMKKEQEKADAAAALQQPTDITSAPKLLQDALKKGEVKGEDGDGKKPGEEKKDDGDAAPAQAGRVSLFFKVFTSPMIILSVIIAIFFLPIIIMDATFYLNVCVAILVASMLMERQNNVVIVETYWKCVIAVARGIFSTCRKEFIDEFGWRAKTCWYHFLGHNKLQCCCFNFVSSTTCC